MITIAYILLALPIALGLYAYALYPGILLLWARRAKPRTAAAATPLPLVTIVVPAYNEQAQIRGSIEALLAQQYPANRRQILIVSDASIDDTDAIVSSFAAQGVELLRIPKRSGKTAAENTSLAHIRGEIVVNCDASVRLHPDAVQRLVAALSDPDVGVASTSDVSVTARQAAGRETSVGTNAAEAGYVGYEMKIRELETRTGGIVGASGSGYAIRADLHRKPVRADLSRDFSAALTARRHNLRAVSVPDALCYVPRTSSLSREYRRKVRTISRGMDTLAHNRDLMDPIHHGAFAWKLVSHKLVRWLVPLSGLLALAGASMLSISHPWSRGLVAFGLVVAALAWLGAHWPDTRSVPRFLPVGVLGALSANLAVIHAAWRVVHGHQDHTWEPTRRTELPDAG